jgi:hypothetical protein
VVKPFFADSDRLSDEVLKLLVHLRPSWELTWNATTDSYVEEESSYAAILNLLILELDSVVPPAKYHDNEDRLAEYVRKNLKWRVHKIGNRWVGADYSQILEQGGFEDIEETDLILAVAGRIRAAVDRGQAHFDDMEDAHRQMLGAILAIILYHRTPLIRD